MSLSPESGGFINETSINIQVCSYQPGCKYLLDNFQLPVVSESDMYGHILKLKLTLQWVSHLLDTLYSSKPIQI